MDDFLPYDTPNPNGHMKSQSKSHSSTYTSSHSKSHSQSHPRQYPQTTTAHSKKNTNNNPFAREVYTPYDTMYGYKYRSRSYNPSDIVESKNESNHDNPKPTNSKSNPTKHKHIRTHAYNHTHTHLPHNHKQYLHTNIHKNGTKHTRTRTSHNPIPHRHSRLSNKSMQNITFENKTDNRSNVENTLNMLEVEHKYMHRALKVYEKHYGFKYNIEIIIEIIYRLKVKDKLKHQKKRKNVFSKHEKAKKVLLSMDFSPFYVKRALSQYQGQNYNIEILTEIIMNLRATQTKGDKTHKSEKESSRKYYIGKMIASQTKDKRKENKGDEFAMYQKMLSMGFENAIAFSATNSNKPKKTNVLKTDLSQIREQKTSEVYDEYYNEFDEYYTEEHKTENVKPEFVNDNGTETLLVDSCDYSVFDCNSFKRVNYILYHYNAWLSKYENVRNIINMKNVGFYDLIAMSDEMRYSNHGLLDDYHHLIYYHDFDQIYNNLTLKCFSDNPARLGECKCLVRNHRNRFKPQKQRNHIYFNTNPKEINTEQICDLVHCYFCHSYHLGLILTPNEFIYIHNNTGNGKDESQTMNGDTIKIQNIQKIVNRKRKRIEALRGTRRLLNYNKFVTKIEERNGGNNSSHKHLLMNKQIGIRSEYYDSENENFVKPKYKSFREEVLNIGIPITEWNILKLRAENMKNKKYSKLIMADNGNELCRIEEHSLMFTEHYIAVLIYCNFDRVQKEFLSNVGFHTSKRHKYAHLGKRVFESVWVFGSNTNNSDIFYHSMCSDTPHHKFVYFASTINCISLPVSTSSKVEVLLNYSSLFEDGIILQMKQNGSYSTMKYFDCEWISDFGGEAELLFFDNSLSLGHTFRINSIIQIKGSRASEYGMDYSKFLVCLNILDKIFNAGYFFGITDLDSLILDTSVDLLNSELNRGVVDHVDHESIPKYVSNLIHLYCKDLKEIKINWPDLLHYYSFIASFLCFKENVFINLRLCVQVFTNCEKIWIHQISVNQKNMDYIYSFLYQNRNSANGLNLKSIEITATTDKSENNNNNNTLLLSFKQCIAQYNQRFNGINCNISIQKPKVNGAPQSLVIQC